MRLFAALPLSQVAVERLISLRLRLSNPKDGLRWTTPEQWHITLQFFGDLPPEQASRLSSELSVRQTAAIALSLESLDLFTSKGILVVAVESSPSLLQLQQAIQEAGERCGIRAESRPFRPHVTLARSKGKAGFATLHKLSSPSLPAFGPALRWCPENLLLLESELTPQGARYREQAHYPLPL